MFVLSDCCFLALQLMHDILVILYVRLLELQNLILLQVKPLPRGCRLTVRSPKLSSSILLILILMVGTLRCKLIGLVNFIQTK